MLKELFVVNCKRFNLGFHDRYSQEIGVQNTIGYTLYLLLRYGQEKRELKFYTQKSLLAFPFELENCKEKWTSPEDQYEICLGIRVFERFMSFYGFVEYEKKKFYYSKRNTELKATPIFESVFELRKDKFQFKKSEYYAWIYYFRFTYIKSIFKPVKGKLNFSVMSLYMSLMFKVFSIILF